MVVSDALMQGKFATECLVQSRQFRGEYISSVRGEYILQSVSCFGANIAHSDLMGSQLTKVSVSRLGPPPCQGPGSFSPQLHISTIFCSCLVFLYLCPIPCQDFLLLHLQSCSDGLGSLPSVSACMGDKLSKVAGICLASKTLFI